MRHIRNLVARVLCIITYTVGQQQYAQPQPLPRRPPQQPTTPDIAPIPVIFVTYGDLPLYLRLNIELSARYNDVVVISDVDGIEHFDWPSNSFHASGPSQASHLVPVPVPITGNTITATTTTTSATTTTAATGNHPSHRIVFEPLDAFAASANRFAPLYKHLSRDNKPNRVKHELRCFQRWFILQVVGTVAEQCRTAQFHVADCRATDIDHRHAFSFSLCAVPVALSFL